MRGAAAMLGAAITFAIGAAAVGAMTVDLRDVANRAAARETTIHETFDPVWLGGELTPIVVEAAPSPGKQGGTREAVRQVPRRRSAPRTTTLRIG